MSIKVICHKLNLQPCDAAMDVYFDREKLIEICRDNKEGETAERLEHCRGMFIACGCFEYIMYLPEEYEERVVWHEALHATTRLWYDAGAGLDSMVNDEVLTYTQGYIVGLIKELYKLREDSK